MLIRRIETADWAELKSVRLAALADAPHAFASTLELEQDFPDQRWQEWPRSAKAIYGAFASDGASAQPSGPIAGMAAAYIRPGGRPDDWHIVSMWVSPAVRGLGVADELVEVICGQARDEGAQVVTLWVTDVNARARAFYERLGFEPTGNRQPVRPEEPDHTETEMARQLG